MIHLKTDEEIEILRENNILVSRTLAEVGRNMRPGITTRELDKIAEDFIRANGAIPACLGYEGYPPPTCAPAIWCSSKALTTRRAHPMWAFKSVMI